MSRYVNTIHRTNVALIILSLASFLLIFFNPIYSTFSLRYNKMMVNSDDDQLALDSLAKETTIIWKNPKALQTITMHLENLEDHFSKKGQVQIAQKGVMTFEDHGTIYDIHAEKIICDLSEQKIIMYHPSLQIENAALQKMRFHELTLYFQKPSWKLEGTNLEGVYVQK